MCLTIATTLTFLANKDDWCDVVLLILALMLYIRNKTAHSTQRLFHILYLHLPISFPSSVAFTTYPDYYNHFHSLLLITWKHVPNYTYKCYHAIFSFWIWVISLTIISPAKADSPSKKMEYYCSVYVHVAFSLYLSINWHLGCFCMATIVNNASADTGVQIFSPEVSPSPLDKYPG